MRTEFSLIQNPGGTDGRVWVCVNGVSFIWFKPEGMGFGKEVPSGAL